MKQLIFTAVMAFFAVTATFAQKSFIGQTKKQVRDYWETQVSTEYMDEGKWDDTGDEYFTIMSGNIGAPAFSATFKNGKCSEQSSSIQYSDISVFQARLKKTGFIYNKEKNTWSKKGTPYYWQITNNSGNYSLECKKV